jgi:hypothetical protein
MKRDLYTKVILTIIAICLVWICLRDINLSPGKLYAGQYGEAVDVKIVGIDKAVALGLWALPVEVQNWPSSLR